jgi:hypothetical protein
MSSTTQNKAPIDAALRNYRSNNSPQNALKVAVAYNNATRNDPSLSQLALEYAQVAHKSFHSYMCDPSYARDRTKFPSAADIDVLSGIYQQHKLGADKVQYLRELLEKLSSSMR